MMKERCAASGLMRRLLTLLLAVSSTTTNVVVSSFVVIPLRTSTTATSSSSLRLAGTDDANAKKSLVVVSPPGGVGEVTAVRAAELGNAVRWFVVSSPSPSQQQQPSGGISSQTNVVELSPASLDSVEKNGGSIELAGADVPSLLSQPEEGAAASALQAVSTWCGSADTLVCTFDGVDMLNKKKKRSDEEDPEIDWRKAIKVAAREAAQAISGTKIAVLSASETEDESSVEEGGGENGLAGIAGSLFGRRQVDIPATLTRAMSLSGDKDSDVVLKLRHGTLFGRPESSPDFSPFVGGPRKVPELCEEYTMRGIRVDPTLSVSGNIMMGQTTRSSRHAVGEAAALLVSEKVPLPPSSSGNNLDVCVSSLPGRDEPALEEWEQEFQRVIDMLSSGEAAQLFSADFANVPDKERLANWLNEKWATAVLRTYDLAAIRTGARPVYANRAGDGKVEIVWQQLVDFDSVTVGKMLIQVSDNGLTAVRAPGDASKGFGAISTKPLAGEDVLVRRLAEAASQAIEKGLAKKPTAKKTPKAPKPVKTVAKPVTSLQSSGPVPVAAGSRSDSGPRQAGARRSTERKRRKSKPSSEES